MTKFDEKVDEILKNIPLALAYSSLDSSRAKGFSVNQRYQSAPNKNRFCQFEEYCVCVEDENDPDGKMKEVGIPKGGEQDVQYFELYGSMNACANPNADISTENCPADARPPVISLPSQNGQSIFKMKTAKVFNLNMQMKKVDGVLQSDLSLSGAVEALSRDMYAQYTSLMEDDEKTADVEADFLEMLQNFDAMEFVAESASPAFSSGESCVPKLEQDKMYEHYKVIFYHLCDEKLKAPVRKRNQLLCNANAKNSANVASSAKSAKKPESSQNANGGRTK